MKKIKKFFLLTFVCVAPAWLLFGPFICMIFIDDPEVGTAVWLGFLAMALAILLILAKIWEKDLDDFSPPIKSEEMTLPFASYEEFIAFLSNELIKDGYGIQSGTNFDPPARISFFTKSSPLFIAGDQIESFLILKMHGISKEMKSTLEELLNSYVESYYNKPLSGNSRLFTIMVYWTEHADDGLREMVDTTLFQWRNRVNVPIAIAFQEKKIYIAKQKDITMKWCYKRLREKWLQLMKKAYEERGIEMNQKKL